MSLQDFIINGINSINNPDDLVGAIQSVMNKNQCNINGKWIPRIDMVEDVNKLYLYVDIPDVEDISVDFFNNNLSISGNKKKKYSGLATKNEIVYGLFNRHVLLPIIITDKKNVILQYKNGVLTISIDKQKEEKNKFKMTIDNTLDSEVCNQI
jgi:HSP20 family molecular chaperone IbpA